MFFNRSLRDHAPTAGAATTKIKITTAKAFFSTLITPHEQVNVDEYETGSHRAEDVEGRNVTIIRVE